MTSAYQNLKDRFCLLSNLNGAGSILYMDSMTAMQSGSENDRSEQSMALATAGQKLLAHPEVKDWLDEAEASSTTLSPGDRKNLQLMRRQWVSATAIPESLVRESARLEIEGNNLHTKYRDKGDWKVMRPVYESAFRVQREIGEILKDALGFSSPYEALLDRFSPGLKLSTVEREFSKLELILPGMITEAMEIQKSASPAIPLPVVPLATLKKIGLQMMLNMGFDKTRGVCYTGDMHPLSGGTPDDSRLTTRYNPKDPLDGLFTIAHETGHSLYEQGTPIEWRYQPAGHTMGMDIHESQSMIMELQAWRQPEFLDYLAHQFRKHVKGYDQAFTAENFAKIMFKVEPSFIRIYADELTYPGHILLRWRTEQNIISDLMTVGDLPDFWNEGMKKTFGIVPPGPAQGHMQDVHWPTLSIGYFPAYTMGAMGGAQFFNTIDTTKPKLRNELSNGEFQTVKGWLVENVHSKGSMLTQDELFLAATGETLNMKYWIKSTTRRYLGREYTP